MEPDALPSNPNPTPNPTTSTQPAQTLHQPMPTPTQTVPPQQPIAAAQATMERPVADAQLPELRAADYNDVYTEICTEIVKEQARIISNKLALEQVHSVIGLSVDPKTLQCTVSGDGNAVVNEIVARYTRFFGYAAVVVCKEAAQHYLVKLSPDQTPDSLK